MIRGRLLVALGPAGAAALALSSMAGAGAVTIRLDDAAWKGQPALPEPVTHHAVLALPKALVVIGGQDRQGRPRPAVYRSVLSAKGDCGKWTSDAALPAGVSDHAAIELGGRVWVMGGLKQGRQSSVATDEIWTAETGADGRIRGWRPAGRLPEPLQGHSAVVAGGRIYVLGGSSGGSLRSAVRMAEPGQRIAAWKPVTALPVQVQYATVVAVGRYLVVIGGQSQGSGKTLVLPTTYVGPIGDDGAVHTWYLGSSKLPGAWLGFGRCLAAGVVWHDQVFCFGGQDPLWFLIDSIASASFDSAKGELGNWGVVPGPADMHQIGGAVAWGDFVYLVGGTMRGAATGDVLRGRFLAVEKEAE